LWFFAHRGRALRIPRPRVLTYVVVEAQENAGFEFLQQGLPRDEAS
jgi:hypothetical protein